MGGSQRTPPADEREDEGRVRDMDWSKLIHTDNCACINITGRLIRSTIIHNIIKILLEFTQGVRYFVITGMEQHAHVAKQGQIWHTLAHTGQR